jgi:hypothetical protein
MGNYVDESDIQTWPSACDDACQAEIVAFAEELVEKILHRSFYPKALDFRMNGNGKNRIFPPLHAPLLTVEHLYICETELDSCYYSWDEHSIFLDMCKTCPSSGGLGVLWYLLTAEAPEGFFPRGYNNVRIVGTYGSSDVPAPLKQAIIWLIDAVNDGSFTAAGAGGYKGEHIGKYSYELGLTAYAKDGIYTGIKNVDKILMHYIKQRKLVIMTP